MELLDLVFDLIGLALGLLFKYWVVGLVILGYLFKRKQGKQQQKPSRRPVFTPVFNPDGQQGTSTNPPPTYAPVTPLGEEYSVEADSDETREASAFSQSDPVAENSDSHRLITRQEQPEKKHTHEEREETALDPREAMKWSIIFSPPRSKQPYSPSRK